MMIEVSQKLQRDFDHSKCYNKVEGGLSRKMRKFPRHFFILLMKIRQLKLKEGDESIENVSRNFQIVFLKNRKEMINKN